MVEKGPTDCSAYWRASIVLTLMIPDTNYSSDDKVTGLLDHSHVPEKSEQVEPHVIFFFFGDLQDHVRVCFVVFQNSY
jgi:hypothetical protein